MTKLFQHLRDWFSLDTRSLAVARMGLGLFVFIDILWRMGSIEWHYTDIGAMPRDIFLSVFSYSWSLSFHHANGSWGFAAAMLVLHAFAAVAMMIGYRTRLSTALVCVFTISLHNRNWFVNNGGDDVLRSIMWLAVFLPWGEMWSVDQYRRGEGARPARLVSGTWVLAWFFQVFAIYFVSYLLKTSPIWRSEYTAVYYSSHLDVFATPIGRWIRAYPSVMKAMTFGTIVLEWLGPLVLFFGFILPRRFGPWAKLGVVFAFWGLHLGIISTMFIGIFPFYCLAMWAAFVPAQSWEKLEASLPRVPRFFARVYGRIAGPPIEVQAGPAAGKLLRSGHQLAGLFMLLTLVFWNLSTLKPPLKYASTFWINVGRWMHIYQEWNMFAPFPKQENLWIEIPAELEDGSTVELITGEADVLSSKQDKFAGAIRDEHWRKFLMNMSDNDKIAKHYAGAWCRIWNRAEEAGGRRPRLRRFSINVYHTVIGLNYQHSPVQKRNLWNHWCFAEDLK